MIAITGATGGLGHQVVLDLLDRGVAASEIVALVRTPAKAADLAEAGVTLRTADYDQADTLGPALAGVDTLLLVSGNEVGQRVRQHQAVIDAAVAAGVTSLVYTSLLHADTSGVSLAAEHLTTEQAIAASGIASTILRNGWYLENYTGQLASTLEQGSVLGATGGATFNPAARADYAAAAAAVLTGEGHAGAVYELGGADTTLDEVAATIARVSGQPVHGADVPSEQFREILLGAGLPEPVAQMLVSADEGIARGDLSTDSGDLLRLAGRELTSFEAVVSAALPS